MKTLYVPCYSKINPLPILEKNIGHLKPFNRIGLFSTIQHLPYLEELARYLENRGKDVFVGGQILGCDIKNALKVSGKVDCLVYVGSGRFHPTAVLMETEKTVFVLNPEEKSLTHITVKDKKNLIKRKKGRISRASEASVYGILVSTKKGQYNITISWNLKDKLEKKGKKAFVFAGEEITPQNVLAFNVDCWVNTTCPRITEDFFEKPVINPAELDYIL